MLTKKRKIVSISILAFIAVIIVALIVGNVIANDYKSIISLYMNQETSKVINVDAETQDTNYFKSDYASKKALTEHETVVAQEIQAEGSVLLKNDGVLPIKKSAKVTLLGQRSVDYLSSGGGSGAIDTKGMPTLKESFEAAGYTVNSVVWDMYNTGAGRTYRGSPSSVNEAPVSIFSATEENTYSSFSDAAIVVIGRTGTESSDLSRTANGSGSGASADKREDGTNKHMLEFSNNELALLEYAKTKFGADKVVVLLNTMNAMEIGPIDTLGLKSCVWVGAGGQKGLLAVPKILNGDMYPSGRLVDTYAYNTLTSPAMVNFGTTAFSGGGGNFVVYQEGIYVGYKYYETRYEDVVLGTANVGTFDYSKEVQFPFGFGLSYTTFEYSNYNLTSSGDSFDASVTIKNTGEAKGKEVVQIYMQSPYTSYDKQNGIEKASVELVAFAKTKELAKNESETVKIQFSKETMRAYDANNKKTYIVDDGTYYFATGRNAHDALNNILAAKGKTTANGMDYNGTAALAKTYVQGAFDDTAYSVSTYGLVKDYKITNQLLTADLKTYDQTVTFMTRNNWTGTYPVKPTLTRTTKMAEEADSRNLFKNDPDAVMPKTETDSAEYGKLTLASLMEAKYDENKYWDALLDRMTATEMATLSRMAGYGTPIVESIAKPIAIDKDGPAGISSTLVGGVGCFGFPIATMIASTYNVTLAEQMGKFVGEDGLYSNTHGWYSPAMNTHRSAFAGRNFEYYSEDGYIAGKIAASTIKGCQSKGVYAFIKHFAFNEQESGRSGLFTFGEEQALREIHLRPFEISVREGDALALMTSMNRVGTHYTSVYKPLMTNILRNEWGFKGFAITDQASTGGNGAALNIVAGLQAGLDGMLNTGATNWQLNSTQSSQITGDFSENATVMTLLRQSSKRILYTISRSHAMNGMSATSKVVEIMPLWQVWLVTVTVIVGVIGVAAAGYIVFRLIKPPASKSKQ